MLRSSANRRFAALSDLVMAVLEPLEKRLSTFPGSQDEGT